MEDRVFRSRDTENLGPRARVRRRFLVPEGQYKLALQREWPGEGGGPGSLTNLEGEGAGGRVLNQLIRLALEKVNPAAG